MRPTTSQTNSIMRALAEHEDERVSLQGFAKLVDIEKSDKFEHFKCGPWAVPDAAYAAQQPPISDGESAKVIILGAGIDALQYATCLIKRAGFRADDIVFVDPTWAFGSTWHWNRCPESMCDASSSAVSAPLEQMGYIRKYADRMAERGGLSSRALFGTAVNGTAWDDAAGQWVTTVVRTLPNADRGDTREPTKIAMQLRSRFLVLAHGAFHQPNPSALDALQQYQGRIFHTTTLQAARPGGNPEEVDLRELLGKRVAFIGSATTAPIVSQLSRWAEELLVFECPAAHVNVFTQRPMDADGWLDTATDTGDAEWPCPFRGNVAALVSRLSAFDNTANPSVQYMEKARDAIDIEWDYHDMPQQEPPAAARLTCPRGATCPCAEGNTSWCRSLCIHNEHIHIEREPNVQTVDTDSRGITGFSQTGVLMGGHEHAVDAIVLSSGYEFLVAGSPACNCCISVTGRGGRGLGDDGQWGSGMCTLHGLVSDGFPNLFVTGPAKGGPGSPDFVRGVGILAKHSASVLAAASEQMGQPDAGRLVIEPTALAEATLAEEVAREVQIELTGGVDGNTGSRAGADYAEQLSEYLVEQAANSDWGFRVDDYNHRIDTWKAMGDLRGLSIKVFEQ